MSSTIKDTITGPAPAHFTDKVMEGVLQQARQPRATNFTLLYLFTGLFAGAVLLVYACQSEWLALPCGEWGRHWVSAWTAWHWKSTSAFPVIMAFSALTLLFWELADRYLRLKKYLGEL